MAEADGMKKKIGTVVGLAICAGALAYLYVTVNTVKLTNRSSTHEVRIVLATTSKFVWAGTLLPGDDEFTWFFPDGDGQLVVQSSYAGRTASQKFGYITTNLGQRHSLSVGSDGRVTYASE